MVCSFGNGLLPMSMLMLRVLALLGVLVVVVVLKLVDTVVSGIADC